MTDEQNHGFAEQDFKGDPEQIDQPDSAHRTAEHLTQAFKRHPNIAVVNVPYLLKK
jgi:hypothetical protein